VSDPIGSRPSLRAKGNNPPTGTPFEHNGWLRAYYWERFALFAFISMILLGLAMLVCSWFYTSHQRKAAHPWNILN
jgi:hypothetical protein